MSLQLRPSQVTDVTLIRLFFFGEMKFYWKSKICHTEIKIYLIEWNGVFLYPTFSIGYPSWLGF